MKLLKPTWVSHDSKPIFSIDIHPAGRRFATGGQGGDSGRVAVWNLDPVLHEALELDPNVPKMLCQMDNHLACVDCVRWSTGGRYLASGGDDKLVMVWALSGAGGSALLGSNGKVNVETWRCVATLRGHAGDVLDLAWSPRDRWLASCSVDNTIIIWNAEKFPEMVSVLNGHTGLVKGVAWDPVGKYLASQSDDKSLRVWKTADWSQETSITEPFEECGGTTHVLRLSWSPDGQYVLSAHAMNGGGPTAQVVERDGWRCDKDFVGHRKAVTCARFNNNILVKEGKKYCCAAVGSRDRALSIWLTSLKRPLVVVQQLFTDSVLDLSWSSDGLNLLACSWDGSVACVQFTNKEIGIPLTLDEKNALYERTYGKGLASESDPASSLLVECPEILLAREQGKEVTPAEPATPTRPEGGGYPPTPEGGGYPPTPDACGAPTTPTPGPLTPLRPVDRQIETRTSDGKRRITPVFIPLTHNADANESLASMGAGGADGCFSSSSQSKSRIRVERRDDIVTHPNVSNHATAPSAPAPAAGAAARVTSFAGATAPVPPASAAAAAAAAPHQHDNNLDNRLKKRAATATLPGPRTQDVCKKRRPSSPAPAAPAAPAGDGAGGAGVLPAPPALGAAGPIVRYAGKYRVQVVNGACSTPHGALTRLQLLPTNTTSSEPVWETYLGSSVVCIACSSCYVCVACADGSLHAWRLAGERALPPLALGARAARLVLQGGRLAALTTRAHLAVWDLRAGECALPAVRCGHLLLDSVTVSNCTLLEDGTPMISTSNGKSYVYSQKLTTWVVWSDASDPLWRACRGAAALRPPSAAAAAAPLYAHAQRALPQHAALHSYTKGKYGAGASTSWLEAQVCSCLHLRLPRDYRHWLLALVSHLVQHGTEEKLRALLDDMLGPSHCTSKSTKWKSDVLGISKHELLSEMLALLVKQLRWQRLYTEYADQLQALAACAPPPPPAPPAPPVHNGH